ncbi:MAG TPA: hypothetical protein VF103_13105, partial [Polyangiaceae bacterium]
MNGVSVVAESVGASDPNCPAGGVKLTLGTEVTYVCNGEDGNGRGPTGPTGPAGASVIATSLAPGHATCAFGGASFAVGSTTTYACNGAPGAPGA